MQHNILAPDAIGLLIGACRRRIKQVVWNRLLEYNLTPQQFRVLLQLQLTDGMSLHALAESIWTDDPTACRIVAKLAERQLIRTESDPKDKRRFRLGLTAKGRRLGQDLTSLGQEISTGIERGFSGTEKDALRGALQKIIANMDRMEAEAAAEPPAKRKRSRA
jgi:DNA-binding MarR family transcriptional regulator